LAAPHRSWLTRCSAGCSAGRSAARGRWGMQGAPSAATTTSRSSSCKHQVHSTNSCECWSPPSRRRLVHFRGNATLVQQQSNAATSQPPFPLTPACTHTFSHPHKLICALMYTAFTYTVHSELMHAEWAYTQTRLHIPANP